MISAQLNTPDPFSQMEAALWAAIEGDSVLSQLVRPNNRIKFHGSDDEPVGDRSSDADFPELTVVPDGGSFDERSSSSSCTIRQAYIIAIKTNNTRTATANLKTINLIKWRLFVALQRQRHRNSGSPGLLAGVPGVRKFDFAGYTDSIDEDTINDAGLAGWSCALRIELTAVFDIAEVVNQ